MTRSVLSSVSTSGRALPSRDGHLPDVRLRNFFLPNPSFEDGIYELNDVLRGLPTSASNADSRDHLLQQGLLSPSFSPTSASSSRANVSGHISRHVTHLKYL